MAIAALRGIVVKRVNAFAGGHTVNRATSSVVRTTVPADAIGPTTMDTPTGTRSIDGTT